jgi:hypothetical protein
MNRNMGSLHPITPFSLPLAEEKLPEMRETRDMFQMPNEKVEYQPEPESLAGFLASLTEKVDELLLAANLRPNLE